MRQKGWGRIINTASAHSLVASPNKSAHVAAKHGVAGFTKTIALEAAKDGVTVNCISPGYVWTPLVENQIGHDEGPQSDPRAGHERRAAGRPANQALRNGRRSGKPGALSDVRRCGLDHRRQPVDGRRLDSGGGPLLALYVGWTAWAALWVAASGGQRGAFAASAAAKM
jgi:NAD(P)-dependent dehydrogenase (short-subunit alcohol dehydrogenase family)